MGAFLMAEDLDGVFFATAFGGLFTGFVAVDFDGAFLTAFAAVFEDDLAPEADRVEWLTVV